MPNRNAAAVAKMLKAIHAQEDKEAAREKAKQVIEKLKVMKLGKAAKTVEAGFEETLTFMPFHLSTGSGYEQTTLWSD